MTGDADKPTNPLRGLCPCGAKAGDRGPRCDPAPGLGRTRAARGLAAPTPFAHGLRTVGAPAGDNGCDALLGVGAASASGEPSAQSVNASGRFRGLRDPGLRCGCAQGVGASSGVSGTSVRAGEPAGAEAADSCAGAAGLSGTASIMTSPSSPSSDACGTDHERDSIGGARGSMRIGACSSASAQLRRLPSPSASPMQELCMVEGLACGDSPMFSTEPPSSSNAGCNDFHLALGHVAAGPPPSEAKLAGSREVTDWALTGRSGLFGLAFQLLGNDGNAGGPPPSFGRAPAGEAGKARCCGGTGPSADVREPPEHGLPSEAGLGWGSAAPGACRQNPSADLPESCA